MQGFSASLHLWGITVIQQIQYSFQNQSQLMLFLSHLGDPRYAFILYFPVVYYLHRSVGTRVLWVAVISEWLNAVAKWLLHGERPYWWVHESGLYPKEKIPALNQFNITCETGPGSPSGHAMISSSVWYVMVSDLIYYKKITSPFLKGFLWLSFFLLMSSICVSRLFIATHFPHQVIAGIFVGILVAKAMNSLSTTEMGLKLYVLTCVVLSSIAASVYLFIMMIGVDPMWSVAMATKWCAVPEWVHVDTSLFYSLVRDVSSLLGLGVAVTLVRDSERMEKHHIAFKNRLLHITLALAVSYISGYLKPPHNNEIVFYSMGFLKHFAITVVIVAGVTRVNI